MRIYCGNLAYSVNDAEVLALFAPFGQVDDVELVRGLITEKSRGFAFVSMPDSEEAERAIKELNHLSHCGRTLYVNEDERRHRDAASARRDRKASMQSRESW